MGDFMKKASICLVLIICVSVFLLSCGKKEESTTTATTDSTTITVTTTITTTTTTTTVSESTTKDAGKMVCSSSPNNPYLNSVVKKYGVDPSFLVAYYNENGTADGNLVFEFNGNKNSDGVMIRSYNNIKNIYTVDASYNCKKATGSKSDGNEYSLVETYALKILAQQAIFKYFADDIQNA